MTTEEVTTKVLAVLAKNGHDAHTSSSLTSDLDMDSLDKVEFAMNLEAEFNIIIPDSDVAQIEYVQHAVDTVIRHLNTIPNV